MVGSIDASRFLEYLGEVEYKVSAVVALDLILISNHLNPPL